MRKVLIAIVVLSLGFAPAPVLRESEKPRVIDQLQGVWEFISETFEGKPAPWRENQVGLLTETIESNHWTIRLDGEVVHEYDIVVDDASDPPRLSLIGKGKSKGLEYKLIISLRGKTMTTCYHHGSRADQYPTSLSGDRPQHVKTIFRRATK